MTTIRQLLEDKGHQVYSVAPNDTVYVALGAMADKNVGALAVLDGANLVGTITERDYARKVFLKGRASPTTRVQEIMETKVFYAQPDQSVEDCMAIMTEKRVRHLPVMEDSELIGVISIGDLVKSIISNQKFLIDQLVHYIHG
jgi:CBS domain-containing protein